MPSSQRGVPHLRSVLVGMILAMTLVLAVSLSATAAEYFLSATTGDDANSGLSESLPLETFWMANELVAPGDTITFLDGVHRESWRQLTVSGTAAQPILIRAKNPRQATLAPAIGNNTTVLLLTHVSYVTVEGLVIDGGSTDPVGAGTGVSHGIALQYIHHMTVRNCRVKDCWGGGIGAAPYTWEGSGFVHGPADYLTFEDNDISGCGFWNTYQCSGISVYEARSAGLGDAPGGFNIIIRRNRVWGCANKITTGGSTNPADFDPYSVTDGNGIIIDDFRNDQTTGYPIYPHRTLVENNIVVGNGGRGVHVFSTDHVTVRNNTCWGNSLLLPGDFKGELSNAWGADNHWYNNLAVATSASIAANGQGILFAGDDNTGCTFAKNLVIGPTVSRDGADAFLTVAQITAANLTASDAQLVAPSNDPLTANFQVQSTSPAVDAGDGTSGRFALTDFTGASRPQRSGIDIGAYELPASGAAGTLAFSASTFSQTEGNAGTSTATITVTRTGGSTGAVGVAYATSNGTATAGSDYTASSGTLSWSAGDAASKTFTVTITGDTAVEASETVTLTLSAVTGGATLGTSSATLTIVNDDSASAGALAFSASTFSQTEGNAGTSTATITVTRTGGSTGAVGVAYATSNGTATAGSDYTASSGTLAWGAGDAASKTFTVTITGDTAVEATETVTLTLSAVTGGATLGTSAATLSIVNDDSSSTSGVPVTGVGGGGGGGCGLGSGISALALACALFLGGRRRPCTAVNSRSR